MVLLGALATLPLCTFLFVAYQAELNHLRADALATQRQAAQNAAAEVQWRLEAIAAQLRLAARLAQLPAAGLEGDLLPTALVEVSAGAAPGPAAAEPPAVSTRHLVLSPFAMAQGRQVAYLSFRTGPAAGVEHGVITGKIALAGLLPNPGSGPQAHLVDQRGQFAPGKAEDRAVRTSVSLTLANGRELLPSGWTIAISDRPAALSAREAELKLRFLVGGGLSLAIGLTLLYVVARLMRSGIEDVVTDFGDFNDTAANSVISEFAQISGALATARAKVGSAARELERARHDALTGLPGRALFLQRAMEQIETASRADDLGVAVIYIDLDGFKVVNDRLGHKAGDELLQRVAGALRQCVRSPDALGRLGGDEFAVCFAAPRESLSELAERTAARITDAVTRLGEEVGCSTGWAIALSSWNLQELLDEADAAMFLAKAHRKRTAVRGRPDGEASLRRGAE